MRSRREITITVSLEDDLSADLTLDYLPGCDATWDDPAEGSEWDILKIEVYKYNDKTPLLDMTETLTQAGFFDTTAWQDKIEEKASEEYREVMQPDPDMDRDD